MQRRGFGTDKVRQIEDKPRTLPPDQFLNSFLGHESGPEGSDEFNMNCNASEPTPSIFSVTIPPSLEAKVSRIHVVIVDNNPLFTTFGALATLSKGVLVQIVNSANEVLLNCHGQRPIQSNADFAAINGVDMQIQMDNGGPHNTPDIVQISFNIFESGAHMLLDQGQKIRFVIQDDLRGLDAFRAVVQGTFNVLKS